MPQASFDISYNSLSLEVPILAIWVADAPSDIIEYVTNSIQFDIWACSIFDEVANELVLSSDHFPKYGKQDSRNFVTMRNR